MRLVDADKFKDLLSVVVKRGVIKMSPSLVAEMIDSEPTIDPMKHGHWYMTVRTGADFDFAYCSECGKAAYQVLYLGHLPYCPNCGAKMDEEVAE